MTRVKAGTTRRKRHKKVLKQAKGYWGARHKRFKVAHEALMHSYQYAYRDRRARKRDMRGLWIARISAAVRMNGLSYNKFVEGLVKHRVQVNRKMLAELAARDPDAFVGLVNLAREGLSGRIA